MLALQLAWAVGAGLGLGYAGGRVIVAALNRYTLPSGLHPWLALASGGRAVRGHQPARRQRLSRRVPGRDRGRQPSGARPRGRVVGAGRGDLVRAAGDVPAARPAGLAERTAQGAWPALGVAAFLMFVARPVAVLLACCRSAIAGRRSASSAGSACAARSASSSRRSRCSPACRMPGLYFNVAFLVVLVSLLVQGWTLARAAHRFGVAVPRADPNTRRIQLDLPGQLEYEMVGYRVAPGSAVLRGAPLPGRVRLAMVVRDGQVLLPDGTSARCAPTITRISSRPVRRRRGWTGCSPKASMRAKPNRKHSGNSSCPATCRSANSRRFTGCRYRALRRGRPPPRCSTNGSTNRRRSAIASRWASAILVVRALDGRPDRAGGLEVRGARRALDHRQPLVRQLVKRRSWSASCG